MSLKKNVLANYAGQLYCTLIAVVMLPFYLEFLGAEAYGLVGFFTLLHAWLALLTAGVTPALARQVAHCRGQGELWGGAFRELLRSIELVLLALALVVALAVWLASPWLAAQWLTVKTLPLADVAYCLTLMGGMIGLRWGVALYAAGLGGLERQVWINGFSMLFATLRFGAAYALLRWVTHDPAHYFEFQLVVSALELVLVAREFYRSQPHADGACDPGWYFSWSALREVLPFTMGIAYTSMLWVLMTQSDKLILSHRLTLAEYGYFALVVSIANGVLQFSAPINQAVLPRLTLLLSQGAEAAMVTLYRTTTQVVVVAVAAVSGMLAAFPQQILYMLTGNHDAAQWGAPVLTWFAIGNAILVVVGMQYLLQYAHGKVRMHVINTTINAAVQVPILAFVAFNFDAAAVAMTWFAIRLATFFVWPGIVHHRFLPGLHMRWLTRDVLIPLVGAALGLGLVRLGMAEATSSWLTRWEIAWRLCLAGLCALLVGAMFVDAVRGSVVRRVKNHGIA